MATLLPEGKQSFQNSAGSPLVGGKLYTYDAGTSTPRATYQDAAGTVPNANPIILDARGEATVFWSGAYKVVLKDSADVTIWTVDNVSSSNTYTDALRTSLGAPSGAGLSGFSYSEVYLAGTVGLALQANINIKNAPYNAKCDGVTDDTAAIQAAATALSVVGGVMLIPGPCKTTAPINWYSRVSMLGVGGHIGSLITGTHAGNLFQYASLSYCTFEKMSFSGAGCSAFVQTAFAANYTEGVIWRECHFYGQLTECIYGNLIFAKILANTFGYYGTVGAAHRHVVSLGTSTNATNANELRGNRFYAAKGNESVRFDSGSGLEIISNNFEANAALPVRLNGIINAKVNANWFEANSITTSEIEINAGAFIIDSTPTEVKGNHFVPDASIVQIIKINNSLTKVYFDKNTGNLTSKLVSNNATKIYSQIGNSFTGLTVPSYLTQEAGTFTLVDASGAGLVLAGGAGTYTRNGNLITFVVSVTYPVTANGNNAKLGGLPYAAAAITPFQCIDNSGVALGVASDAAATTMAPYLVGALTPRTNANMSGKLLYLSGSYSI